MDDVYVFFIFHNFYQFCRLYLRVKRSQRLKECQNRVLLGLRYLIGIDSILKAYFEKHDYLIFNSHLKQIFY